MNTYNHHRIIDELAINECLNPKEVKLLKEASDFADDFMGDTKGGQLLFQKQFFYFHFYYDMSIQNDMDNESGTIILNRVGREEHVDWSMSQCNYDNCKSEYEYIYNSNNYNGIVTHAIGKNYKKFFTAINGRENYLIDNDITDSSNQSDCVAFLHAMGAENETREDARKVFENHLKKCFAEYLFLTNPDDALFMLGIALHGIMDSFTPSHMDFQQYRKQDMALHAQGDVIPFRYDEEQYKKGVCTKELVLFDPGQFSKERKWGKAAALFKKGYNSSDNINDVELKMFKIFIDIFCLNREDKDIRDFLSNAPRFFYTQYYSDHYVKEVRSKKLLNNTLKNKTCGNNAFIFYDKALKAVSEVYKILKRKKDVLRNHNDYCMCKDSVVKEALDKWRDCYDDENMIKCREKLNKNYWVETCGSYSMFVKLGSGARVKEEKY